MMDKFEIGEIAVICLGKPSSTDNQSDYVVDGLECEIIRIGGCGIQANGLPSYVISVDGYGEFDIAEHALRKKKPPEEPATWQEIQRLTNWNPTEQKVTQ